MEPGKDKYRLLIEHLPDAFAYHQTVMDSEGNPVDYIFLDVNPAFEKMTGLSREQLIGKKATKLPPDIENYSIDWIGIFGKVALTGENAGFEHYFDISDRWYAVTAYSDEPGYFAVLLRDITEGKQAREPLRESEQRYKLLVDHAGEAIVVIQDGIVKFANPATVQTFGYSEEKLGSVPFIEFLHPEDRNLATEEYTKVLSGKTVKPSYNIRVITEKGTLQWVEFNGVQIEWENRPAFLCFARDITTRKQAEEELRKSEEKYRLLSENASDVIWTTDLDLNYTYISPSGEHISGYTVEEIMSMGVHNILTPSSLKQAIHVIQKELELDASGKANPNRTQAVELEQYRKDGSTAWVEIKASFLRDQEGRSTGILGIKRDISDRKEVEEALRESGEKHRRLFETMAQGVIYQATDGTIIFANPAAERILGLSLEQMQGKTSMDPYWKMIKEDGTAVPGTEHPTMIALRTGKIVGSLTRGIFRPDKNDYAWLNITAIPLFQPGETEPFQAYATFEDITARKQAEEALRRRLLELEAIYTVSSALRSAETLDEMLNILIDETLKVLGTEDGAVFFYHPTKEALRFTATRGWFNQLDDAWLKPGEGIAWEVFVSGQVLVSREFAKDSRVKYIESMPEGCGGVCFPIRTAKDVVGTMFVSVPLPREITREELNLLASLSEIASTAIHRISLFQETVNLLENLQESNIELLLAYDATLEGWSRALELRDHETEGHSERVADKTIQIAMLLNVPDDELVNIRRGSLLHDIGKIGIPDAVLLKPGKLSPQEWGMMQQHPKLAYELLSPVDYLHPALDIPYCHHEKWDGSGYPRGLKGKEIPLAARIFAVIDVYDALTSDRPYRLAWSKQEVLEHICEQSGKHFDPQVVEVFENLFDP